MNALSLFANVGIAETYLSNIGINVVVANEIDEQRSKFYSYLYPTCDMIQGDITDPLIYDRIISKAKEAQVDLIMATPPCQGMSIAGHNSPYDERNSLIKYAIDAVIDLNPKFVFFENVTLQLVTPIIYEGEEIKIPEYIHRRLSPRYKINHNVVTNAMDYSVPQRRERCIYLLVRNDIDKEWEFPKPSRIITLEEAFNGIPDLWPTIKENAYQGFLPPNTEESLNFHKWHKPPIHVWRNIECMLHTPTGNTAFDNSFYYPKKTNGERVRGYDTTYHRLFWDKPAATVTMWNGILGSQNNVHPGRFWKKDNNGDCLYTNPRVLTIYELMVVSSLPLDWNIPDWANDQLIRFVIGEGIPPLMVKKIIEQIMF
ncbi:MAG: DNA cytosine methyltransferase [Paludibacteraceae bacterium]|nr:DNA cytosine methyltransferase [Paludibacteraceae bacterium]